MTTLITGGTGKTGGSLARLLHAANQPLLIATRSGVAPAPYRAVKFDWFNKETFAAPFEVDPNIEKIYLVAPTVFNSLSIVQPFIDLAVSRGVKRIVLCSSTNVEKGTVPSGKIHEYLASTGIDYVVIRLSWFIENFSILYLQSIRDKDEIYSVAKDGKVAFIAVEDIGKAIFEAITAETTTDREVFVVGPELYTHDEAAALFTEVLGRKITHKRLSLQECSKVLQGFGLSPEYTDILATLNAQIGDGVEENIYKNTPKKTFKGKITVREYVEANKGLWSKA